MCPSKQCVQESRASKQAVRPSKWCVQATLGVMGLLCRQLPEFLFTVSCYVIFQNILLSLSIVLLSNIDLCFVKILYDGEDCSVCSSATSIDQ